jgi:hypothetical protein
VATHSELLDEASKHAHAAHERALLRRRKASNTRAGSDGLSARHEHIQKGTAHARRELLAVEQEAAQGNEFRRQGCTRAAEQTDSGRGYRLIVRSIVRLESQR